VEAILKEDVLMNRIEQALIHALFVHLHHNADKGIDFGMFKRLNQNVDAIWPGHYWWDRMQMMMRQWFKYQVLIVWW
jgi:hypothetical protein